MPTRRPVGRLHREIWLEHLARWLTCQPQHARVRVARRLGRAIRDQTREIRQLLRELTDLVTTYRPRLLAIPGCGPLIDAILTLDEVRPLPEGAVDIVDTCG